MKLDERLYYFKNGEMKLLSSWKMTFKISNVEKPIRKWYRQHPYSKRLNKKWICGDYRIDQQRPQRKVYSEWYLKIVEITEMEERYLDDLIKKIESEIDYPCVWDDGKNRYYEDVIHCPNCGKRRKVLTSKTNCEFCGFEFKKALKCPNCKDLSLNGSEKCIHCGYEFHKKDNPFERINRNGVEIIRCPKCGSVKLDNCDKCRCCNFNFKNKKKCVRCKSWVDEDSNFCNMCGQKLEMFIYCGNCGFKNSLEYNFCSKCGCRLG